MKRIGRRPRIKDIKRAQELRRLTNMSIMDISRVVLKREDKTTIHRWLQINVRKLEKELSTP